MSDPRFPALRAATIVALNTLLALLVVFAAAELYLRAKWPFIANELPYRHDVRFGFRFAADATIRYTNLGDFWVEQKANSLGFLDREPPGAEVSDECRIVLIGDSMVEAQQVPVGKKFQVLLEDRLNAANPRRRVRTIAFGISGTGQANQLPMYDHLARAYRPDVVVLVLANNDFANNSTFLEAVRNGWHPLHPPRLFIEKDAAGAYRTIAIDADWAKRLLPQMQHGSWAISKLNDAATRSSYAYAWTWSVLSSKFPKFAAYAAGGAPTQPDKEAFRLQHVAKERRGVFDGWRFPDDLNIDQMFDAEDLPRHFADTLDASRHAFAEFKARGERDGYALLALAAYTVGASPSGATKAGKRPATLDKQLGRWQSILDGLGVPMVDQAGFARRSGIPFSDLRFSRDAHWSERGHAVAADALAEYFRANGGPCPESRPR